MPAADRVDPTTLDAVAAQLARSSTAALEASYELLAHYSDTGDASTQRAVDTLIDDAADSLRALANSLAETARRLEAAATLASGKGTLRRGEVSATQGDGSLTRTGPRRGHFG